MLELSSHPPRAPGDLIRALRATNMFGTLPSSALQRLAASTTRTTVHRGDVLWHAGEKATRFFVVASGVVKLTRTDAVEGEVVVALFVEGESVADAVVLARGTHPGTAIVQSARATLLEVRAETFLEIVRTEPLAVQAMARAILDHVDWLHGKIAVMAAGGAPRRLAVALRRLTERYGTELDPGRVFVPISLSRGEMAGLIGARVETTTRIVARWQREKLVEATARGLFVLDGARLRHIADHGE